ncbi:hypothetical protein BGZ54_006930 [Gamsiella multidivaricata]|nr:hypothetical protein BGZ54_006930 [Gamsiella multidivaricata]
MVSDCMAISPEFAVGVDSSGGIFGLGYSREDPGCQHTLVDRFSFHLGEVVNRIRIAKIWPADVRSLAGISLSQRTSDTETTDATVFLECDSWRPSSGQLSSWILLPWTMDSNIQPSSSTQLTQLTAQLSSQALIACSLIGSIFGFWSLNSQVYLILSSLQSILQTTYECRPVLGNLHDRYRSLSSPGSNTVDGDLLYQFLGLDHELQVQLVSKAVGLERIVDGWLLQTGMGTQEQIYLSSAPRSVSKDNTTIESGCLMHKQPGQNQGRCKATNVICHIVEYLHSLDWHQQ